MDWERMREMATMGGCGEVATRILSRVSGTPGLRYEDGRAVHAAVLIDRQWRHLGEDYGLVEVSLDEFQRACREDFDPDRVIIDEEDDDLINEWVEMLVDELG